MSRWRKKKNAGKGLLNKRVTPHEHQERFEAARGGCGGFIATGSGFGGRVRASRAGARRNAAARRGPV